MKSPILQLERFLNRRQCTLLFGGPMTRNVVDALIDHATNSHVPIGIVATRRQIETRELGGGYVNNWSTESFAQYIRERDFRHLIVLERDHGGPWQGDRNVEKDLLSNEAMELAKLSFRADIQAGMDLIHIDPSKGPSGANADLQTFTERTIELIEYCVEVARSYGRLQPPVFEVGTDEGALARAEPDEIEAMYLRIRQHCDRSRIEPPRFIALPIGTLVKERRNAGTLERQIARYGDIAPSSPQSQLLHFCHSHGLLVKEHNADYLSDRTLEWHVRSSVDAINIAPQLGVTETKCFVEVLREEKLTKLLNDFIDLVIASRQWERWLLPASGADELECAIIAGHYVFATDAYREIRSRAEATCLARGIDLDKLQYNAVYREILRQLRLLSIVPSGRRGPSNRHGSERRCWKDTD